jgi:hypothetical protein
MAIVQQIEREGERERGRDKCLGFHGAQERPWHCGETSRRMGKR